MKHFRRRIAVYEDSVEGLFSFARISTVFQKGARAKNGKTKPNKKQQQKDNKNATTTTKKKKNKH